MQALIDVIDVVESDGIFLNRSPYGEPQLGPRGLYRGVGRRVERGTGYCSGSSASRTALTACFDISDAFGARVPGDPRAERLQAHDLVGRTA